MREQRSLKSPKPPMAAAFSGWSYANVEEKGVRRLVGYDRVRYATSEKESDCGAVSYTHLTLPTKRIV